mmetsp:Transcript_21180/g.53857  ORF Transcript_21180/g.53857 Transcript_21180/m.53857 type:complete len:211 (+) Transcript_21180:274-906(+)
MCTDTVVSLMSDVLTKSGTMPAKFQSASTALTKACRLRSLTINRFCAPPPGPSDLLSDLNSGTTGSCRKPEVRSSTLKPHLGKQVTRRAPSGLIVSELTVATIGMMDFLSKVMSLVTFTFPLAISHSASMDFSKSAFSYPGCQFWCFKLKGMTCTSSSFALCVLAPGTCWGIGITTGKGLPGGRFLGVKTWPSAPCTPSPLPSSLITAKP